MNSSDVHTVQSRMKHRKVLGVGESADGKIPRSKISQLLGSEHLNHIVIEKGEYPRGMRVFQWLTCFFFGTVGLINIIWPQHFYRSATPSLKDPSSLVRQVASDFKIKTSSNEALLQLEDHFKQLESSLNMLDIPVRLYGTACLSLCALFFIVAVINKDNRRAVRIALAVQATYFALDILVTWLVINPLNISNTTWLTDPVSIFWLTMYKAIGILLSAYYYVKTHPHPARVRDRYNRE